MSEDTTTLSAAWNTLWEPFGEFAYAAREDRAITAAALLTAVVRKRLPLAPAFAFDGPPASGKTSLITSIAELAGSDIAVVSGVREEDELRKRLFAALRDGQPSICLDDAGGRFNSATLEACLALDHVAERTIGALEPELLPTNIVVLIAGDVFVPRGDLWRRIVTARINPRAEYAERHGVTFDIRKHCRDHRQELITAALTLLDGFIAAGKPRVIENRLKSYEEWDGLIRQCILWLNAEGIAELGDPIASISDRAGAQSRT